MQNHAAETTAPAPRTHWNDTRETYTCADGRTLRLPNLTTETTGTDELPKKLPRNGICATQPARTVASDAAFDRAMKTTIRWGDARTAALPRSVREVRENAFGDAKRLHTAILNEGLAKVCDRPNADERGNRRALGAFENSAVARVRLPGTLRALGAAAFAGCARLRRIALPGALESLGAECFARSGLKRVCVPAGVRKIGPRAFARCFQLHAVEIAPGSRLEAVGDDAFERASGASPLAVYVDSGTGFDLRPLLDSAAFVVAVEGVGGVLAAARLEKLRKLRKVALPAGLAAVGAGWFAESGVREVEVAAGVLELREGAFSGCARLRRIALPEGLVEVGDACFAASGLREIKFPTSVAEIGARAFLGCGELESAAFGENSRLRALGYACFRDAGLRRIEIPKTTAEIGDSAFEGCARLESASFAENSALETVPARAFARTALAEFRCPARVRKIESAAFEGCVGLGRVELGPRVEEVGFEAFCCAGLEALAVPAAVRAIGASAFAGCERLREVAFARGSALRGVGVFAFSGTRLRRGSVRFPPGARVEEGAFDP